MSMGLHSIEDYFGEFIKIRRDELGMSQETLGKKAFPDAAYPKQSIQKIEAGKNITIKTMERILIALASDVKFIKY